LGQDRVHTARSAAPVHPRAYVTKNTQFWPNSVIRHGHMGFRLFWTWKVRRGQRGRPAIARETRDLIRRMCRENPTWGAPRIHGELLKLGIDIGESSVTKYMLRCRKRPSQTWCTFLDNHLSQLVSIDFFTVPTIRFQVLYVFCDLCGLSLTPVAHAPLRRSFTRCLPQRA
jgi:hypothetical protein